MLNFCYVSAACRFCVLICYTKKLCGCQPFWWMYCMLMLPFPAHILISYLMRYNIVLKQLNWCNEQDMGWKTKDSLFNFQLDNIFFFCLKCPKQFWAPPSLQFHQNMFSRGQRGWSVKLISHFCRIPQIEMCEFILALFLLPNGEMLS